MGPTPASGLAACKSEANPQKRDECISNVKNRYEKGKGIEKMATASEKDVKAKAADKADAAMKDAKGKAKTK